MNAAGIAGSETRRLPQGPGARTVLLPQFAKLLRISTTRVSGTAVPPKSWGILPFGETNPRKKSCSTSTDWTRGTIPPLIIAARQSWFLSHPGERELWIDNMGGSRLYPVIEATLPLDPKEEDLLSAEGNGRSEAYLRPYDGLANREPMSQLVSVCLICC